MAAKELYSTPLFSDANLIAYYRMEGNSNDSSTSGANGSDTSVSYNSSYGKFGQGASFNGSSSRIQAATNTALNAASAALSVSFWFYTTATGSERGVVDKGRDGYGAWSISLDTVTGYVSFRLVVGGNQRITSSVLYPTNAWVNIIVTYNNSDAYIYQNGTQVATGHFIGGIGTNSVNLFIGSWNDGSFFTGYEDDVAVFNRVLTATEINSINNGLPTGGAFLYNLL